MRCVFERPVGCNEFPYFPGVLIHTGRFARDLGEACCHNGKAIGRKPDAFAMRPDGFCKLRVGGRSGDFVEKRIVVQIFGQIIPQRGVHKPDEQSVNLDESTFKGSQGFLKIFGPMLIAILGAKARVKAVIGILKLADANPVLGTEKQRKQEMLTHFGDMGARYPITASGS